MVIKVLPPEMSAGVNQDRFRREIQLAASLQHPHVVPLLTAGSHDDLLHYVSRASRCAPSSSAKENCRSARRQHPSPRIYERPLISVLSLA